MSSISQSESVYGQNRDQEGSLENPIGLDGMEFIEYASRTLTN